VNPVTQNANANANNTKRLAFVELALLPIVVVDLCGCTRAPRHLLVTQHGTVWTLGACSRHLFYAGPAVDEVASDFYNTNFFTT
jgi:hypothetical protein